MENNIEEDIKNAEHFINSIKTDKEYKEGNGWHGYYDKEIIELARMLEHILSNYKRVLKENEKLKKFHIQDNKHLDFIMKNSIPVQKVKAKIEELNDVSNAEELEDTMDGKNYTITELVQYVLQELLESEE